MAHGRLSDDLLWLEQADWIGREERAELGPIRPRPEVTQLRATVFFVAKKAERITGSSHLMPRLAIGVIPGTAAYGTVGIDNRQWAFLEID